MRETKERKVKLNEDENHKTCSDNRDNPFSINHENKNNHQFSLKKSQKLNSSNLDCRSCNNFNHPFFPILY